MKPDPVAAVAVTLAAHGIVGASRQDDAQRFVYDCRCLWRGTLEGHLVHQAVEALPSPSADGSPVAAETNSPTPTVLSGTVEQVPWQVARDAYAYPRGDTEADDWAGVVSAVLAHAAKQRARDGFVEVAGDLLARTAEILEQHDHKALPFALRAALAGAQNDAATS